MSSVDPRLDRLERLVDRVQEQINQLHSSSMQMVTTAFAAMEARLSDKIDKQTQDLGAELNKLRSQVVPMSEHEHLMSRVDQLWTRDLGARSDWDEIVHRVPVLWDERTRFRAILAAVAFIEVAAGAGAGIWAAFHH